MTIRIIAGRLKGRSILTSKDADYRPTTGRAKETLFSILGSGQFVDCDGISILDEAVVLDICAGTGALGFEALSRGADHVTFLDSNREHLRFIHQNALRFEVEALTRFWHADATALGSATKKYNLVFIDPPYHQDITSEIMASLADDGWLADNALVITELPLRHKLEEVEQYKKVYFRSNGRTAWHFWRYRVEIENNLAKAESSGQKQHALV